MIIFAINIIAHRIYSSGFGEIVTGWQDKIL